MKTSCADRLTSWWCLFFLITKTCCKLTDFFLSRKEWPKFDFMTSAKATTNDSVSSIKTANQQACFKTSPRMRTAMCLYLADDTEICAQSLAFSLLSELIVKTKINNVYRDRLQVHRWRDVAGLPCDTNYISLSVERMRCYLWQPICVPVCVCVRPWVFANLFDTLDLLMLWLIL